jgi:hypothetical protein
VKLLAAVAQGACLVRDMGVLVASDVRSAFSAVTRGSRRGRFLTVVWGCTFALYTTLDDVPAGLIFGVVAGSWGLAYAVAAVGLGSTTLAWSLAKVQRHRTLSQLSSIGAAVSVQNDPLWKDLVTTFGIGVPATVLAYPPGRVPTIQRALMLSALYGFVGQGASYAGISSVGDMIGVNPYLALAVGIGLVIFYRYAMAVRVADRAGAGREPRVLPAAPHRSRWRQPRPCG